MSITTIKKQINKFISHDTPEVIAIKGAWGVGKTYAWNEFLLNAKKRNQIALERYSYVSMFGINSLDAFKYAIFENVVNRDLIGSGANVETFKQNTSSLLENLTKKSFKIFKDVSILKGITPAIESLSFLSLSQTLICIDDLERKGKMLDIRDVLGLISLLKEQKKCKIIILLNDGEDGLEEYSKYKEKVIDLEMIFAPTATECAEIAFQKNSYESNKLKELTPKLEIKNIRVLKKIEKLAELCTPLASSYEQELRDQLIHSLVLFTYCHYCSKSVQDIPPLEFTTHLGYNFLGIGTAQDDNEEKKKWRSLLHSYNYNHTDSFDIVLAESIRAGYFIEEDFKREAEKKNKEIIASRSSGSFKESWNLYHETFDNNADEVISSIYESFKKNIKYISTNNLNGTVILFRQLGENQKASEIIDIYIRERIDEEILFDLARNNFFGDIIDPEIVHRFNDICKELSTKESAKQVLERIAGKNGWNDNDIVVLASTTIDEYYSLFKSLQGEHIYPYINTCLQFNRFVNPSDQYREIAEKAIEALKKIAAESEINRLRVRKFGIDV